MRILRTLSVSILFMMVSAQCSAIDIPEYSRVEFPRCSCSCQNKMIFKRVSATQKNILKWAEEAAKSSLSYGFGNYKSALESASQYYTRAGWEHFLDALLTSKNLEVIQEEKYIVNITTKGPATITKTKNKSHPQTWLIELPMQAKYINAQSTLSKNLVITLKIIQMVEDDDTIQSLGIEQFILREDK